MSRFVVENVGELRDAIQSFTDECQISVTGQPVSLTYQIDDGEGRLIVRPAQQRPPSGYFAAGQRAYDAKQERDEMRREIDEREREPGIQPPEPWPVPGVRHGVRPGKPIARR